jgi:sec-independent protein translocase protein TatB
MFDIGWTELLLIGLVALIVVGPKDLPGMFRTLGQFTAKARRMARDFQRAMEEAADDAGIKDAASTLKSATNPKKMGLDALNDAAEKFDKWEPGKTSTAKRAEMTEERQAFADKLSGRAAEDADANADPELQPEPELEAEAPKPPKTPAQDAKDRGA